MCQVNVCEALILGFDRRGIPPQEMLSTIVEMQLEIVPLLNEELIFAAEARLRLPLNFGDCFAYALAKSRALPLITLDADFKQTDCVVILPEQ